MKPVFSLKVIFTALLLTLFIEPLAAQIGRIKFDNISLEQGLTQSSVYCILQDSKGFMWFGTMDGLNKYDGYSVTPYRNNPKDSFSISDNSINVLFEDSDGWLWVGTKGKGLCRYDPIKNRFINFKHDERNSKTISHNNVRAIYEDKKGILWIGTEGGLNRFDKKQKVFKSYKQSETGLSNNVINKIISDKAGNLWIATNEGLNRFDTKTEIFRSYKNIAITEEALNPDPDKVLNKVNTIYFDSKGALWIGSDNGLTKRFNDKGKYRFKTYVHDNKNKNSLSSDIVTSILEDQSGIFWIGTEKGGLNRFDEKTEHFDWFVNEPTDPHSISVNNVLNLFLDKTNILWIGTSLGGVNKWNRTVEGVDLFRHNPYEPKSLSASQVRTFYQDRENNLWIGTVDGGLNRWDIINKQFTHFKNNPLYSSSLSQNHVRTILEDNEGNFWVGTEGGGLNKLDIKHEKFTRYQHDDNNPNSIPDDKIWKIFQDSNGTLWIGTYGGGLCTFDIKSGRFKTYRSDASNPKSISSDFVTTIVEDRKKRLWIGTYGGGLNLWLPKEQGFKKYVNSDKDLKSIGNDRVYSIFEDSDGDLWVGTKGNLNRFFPEKNQFIRYDERDGLPNNVIMGILEDDHKNLWISTNKGLCKFNKKTLKVRCYDVKDGLQSNEFLVGSYLKMKDGLLLFGGINGFNSFMPDKIKDNEHIPNVFITRFQVFNKDFELENHITETKKIVLNYDQNFISFEFVALNYVYPEKNQYKYFLSGKDKDTNYVKDRRFASYTDLEPGTYIFTVKGSNNDGKWNNIGASVEVIIKPAFWQTKWFQGAVLLVILISFFAGYKWRVHRIEAQKQYLEQVVKLRTAEIISQKEEIEAQRDAIEVQRDEIETQRDELQIQRDIANTQRDQIAHQKKEITDSIFYAQRIQAATMTTHAVMKDVVDDHFILFKPKDIVSGDFYWATRQNDKLIIIAADCTGHGVPGAFMSMLGISFLNKIVSETGLSEPHEILNKLRENVIHSLHQRNEWGEAKDGMDAALCTIDLEEGNLLFAGANNPLYLIRDNKLEIVKSDKMPIAIFDCMDSFTTHEIKIQKGDTFFIFSDGYADQFGGSHGKKFKAKPFQDILLENIDKSMSEIRDILDSTIEEWKSYPDRNEDGKPFQQVDDILVIGFRI